MWPDKSTQRKRGSGQEKPGSRPKVGARFKFTVLLMSLLLEKKLELEGVILNSVYPAQILGFDILLMKNLKPILLEVNANPSMRIEHEQEVSTGTVSLNMLPDRRWCLLGSTRFNILSLAQQTSAQV